MSKLVIEIKLGIYQHYKGNLYQVLHIAKHSETEEALVVYRALYQAYGVWVRPLAMFAETVEVCTWLRCDSSYFSHVRVDINGYFASY